jgi:hypothetical protein
MAERSHEQTTGMCAEGVPSLINVQDELGFTRACVDLVSFALDSMAYGDNPGINALQVGMEAVLTRLKCACEMLEAHREGNR